ncbi:MAG: hypothetical protein BYD32DRAFT_406098 [Podila humilis]|nr:MAG: hypothetical protein BYD32DRAFT_406098 [Podila humilis]
MSYFNFSESLPVLQLFRSKDGQPLGGLSTDVSEHTNERYVLWSHVENSFPDKSHVQDENDSRILFMTDNDYRIITPLRIKYSSRVYTVVSSVDPSSSEQYGTLYSSRPFSPAYDQLEAGSASLHNLSQSHDLFFSIPSTTTTNAAYRNILGWYQMYASLFPILEQRSAYDRHYFLIVLANLDHLHMVVNNAISKFTTDDPVEKQGIVHMQEGLSEMFSHVEHCELVNRIYETLRNCSQCVEFAAPRLFLVLPEGLDRWNIQDPRTHKFRLFFICDFNYNKVITGSGRYVFKRDQVQHVHITDHPGYAIKQPVKFFQQFGFYCLTMLQMVKFGLLERDYFVPELSTFSILSCCTAKPRHNLQQDSLGHLVKISISYIKGLKPRFRVSKTWLDGQDTHHIQSHLTIPPNDDGMGGMHRNAYKRYDFWMCADHSTEQLNIQGLQSFIDVHGGYVSVALNKAQIQLESMEQAINFYSVLMATGRTFELSLNLMWSASRTELQEILRWVDKTGTVVLEIDGVTLDAHPQSPFRYGIDVFAQLLQSNNVKYIALNNYPRRLEQYLYIGESGFFKYGFRFVRKSRRSDFAWLELRKCLDLIMEKLTADNVRDNDIGLRELAKALSQYEGSDLKSIDIFDTEKNIMWQGSFRVKHNTVTGLQDAVHPSILPQRILEGGTLRRLLVRSEALYDHSVLRRLMDANQQLQHVELQVPENRMLTLVSDHIGKRLNSIHPLQISLFEMQSDLEGRGVATIVVECPSYQDRHPDLVRNHSQVKAVVTMENIEVISWSCDAISSTLSEKGAALLNLATQQNRSALTRFTLDITFLTETGLHHIIDVLKRSALECLHIRCVPIRPRVRQHLAALLGAVQWSTIKTLILSGNSIDQWLQFWINEGSLVTNSGTHMGPRLMCLELFDSGMSENLLSHAAALALHHIVYSSQLSVLNLENVKLQENRDWDLIVEALDITVLEELSLCWGDIVGVDRIKQLLTNGHVTTRVGAPEQYSATLISDLRATHAVSWIHPEQDVHSISHRSDHQSVQDNSDQDSPFQSPGDSTSDLTNSTLPSSEPTYHDVSWNTPLRESYLSAAMDPNWNAPGETPIAHTRSLTTSWNWTLPHGALPYGALDQVPLPSMGSTWEGPTQAFHVQPQHLMAPELLTSLRRQPSTGPPESMGSRPRRTLAPQLGVPSMDVMSPFLPEMQFAGSAEQQRPNPPPVPHYSRPPLEQHRMWSLNDQLMARPPLDQQMSWPPMTLPYSVPPMEQQLSWPPTDPPWEWVPADQTFSVLEQPLPGLPVGPSLRPVPSIPPRSFASQRGGLPMERPMPPPPIMEEWPDRSEEQSYVPMAEWHDRSQEQLWLPIQMHVPVPAPAVHTANGPVYYNVPEVHVYMTPPPSQAQRKKSKRTPRPSPSRDCSVM